MGLFNSMHKPFAAIDECIFSSWPLMKLFFLHAVHSLIQVVFDKVYKAYQVNINKGQSRVIVVSCTALVFPKLETILLSQFIFSCFLFSKYPIN